MDPTFDPTVDVNVIARAEDSVSKTDGTKIIIITAAVVVDMAAIVCCFLLIKKCCKNCKDKSGTHAYAKGMMIGSTTKSRDHPRVSYTDASRAAIEGNKGIRDTERVSIFNNEDMSSSDDSMGLATTNVAVPALMYDDDEDDDDVVVKHEVVEEEVELEHIWKHSMEAMQGSTRQILPTNNRTTMTETYVGDHELLIVDEGLH